MMGDVFIKPLQGQLYATNSVLSSSTFALMVCCQFLPLFAARHLKTSKRKKGKQKRKRGERTNNTYCLFP
jgi:hypothetical protein